MSRKSVIASALLVVFAFLFAAVLIANFSSIKNLVAHSQVDFKTEPPVKSVNTDIKGLNDAFVEISKAVTPSVVYIDVTTNPQKNEQDKNFQFFFGPDFKMDEAPTHGTGSGVIISKDGYIITNNHVVKEANDKGIKVILTDKREFSAKLIGTDPNTDIAVIKIDADDLTVASVGNSDEVQVGQWVLAIGNPLGLNNTVTSGIVSALGRNINISGDTYAINNFIQTDAVINPGNSGGALVNINGAVIGINAAIKSNSGYYQGYGFAIPINIAKNAAEELIKSGKIERGYIGVAIKDIDEKEAKGLGLNKPKGVLVQSVIKDGAGEEAGIKMGDIIMTVDGKEVDAANQLQTLIGSKRPGEQVNLSIFRDGKTIEKKVTLKPRSDKDVASNNNINKNDNSPNLETKKFDNIGLVVMELTSATQQEYSVKNGILIKEVSNFSESYNRGLRPGLVILEADKNVIESVSQFDSIVSKKSKGEILMLKVMTPSKDVRLIAIEIQ
jgi:serine protease Do